MYTITARVCVNAALCANAFTSLQPHPSPAPPPLPTPGKCAPPAAGQRVGLWGCSPANVKGQEWKVGPKGRLELAASGGKLGFLSSSSGIQSACFRDSDTVF